MRTLLIILFLFTLSCIGLCVGPQADNTLRFYVVSDEPIAGGRYVDTPECPKVGYITNSPSLVITRLQSVSANTSSGTGSDTDLTQTKTDVAIQMFSSDAKRFADITRQNIGRRLLICLGDRPLIAPIIQAPIETGSMLISVGRNKDGQAIAAALKRFVRHERAAP